MKKLLLSSIIMLGVCGIASAQTDSKVSPKHLGSTTAAAPATTPQKAALTTASDVAATASVAPTSNDKQAVAPASIKPARIDKATAKVNAAGVATPDVEKRKEEKMAAVKAANAATSDKQQK